MLQRQVKAVAQAWRSARALHTLHNPSHDSTTSAALATLPVGFVFDIDGVLVRGREVLPEAVRALKSLYHPGGKVPRVPVAFLTNGGGVTEQHKANTLSEQLRVNILPQQVVLAHTPFRAFAPEYAEKPVLVVGRGHPLNVAKQYGFNKLTTSAQLAKAMPTAVPFWQEIELVRGPPPSRRMPEAPPRYLPTLNYGSEANPIKSIFVFSDPADWYIELQIMIDVVMGNGVMGRRPEEVPAEEEPIRVFFSNPDLLWANEHPTPRFGQGAFAACFEELHQRVTGKPLQAKTVFGKPNAEPYRLVESLLIEQARSLGQLPAPDPNSSPSSSPPPFAAIFAIGDNSHADVSGANSAGDPWVSILVRTGVFSGPGENCHVHPAKICVDHVEDAVKAALNHSRSFKWHSMR